MNELKTPFVSNDFGGAHILTIRNKLDRAYTLQGVGIGWVVDAGSVKKYRPASLSDRVVSTNISPAKVGTSCLFFSVHDKVGSVTKMIASRQMPEFYLVKTR